MCKCLTIEARGDYISELLSNQDKNIVDYEEKWFFHLIGFFAPILVITSNIIGGWWTASGAILTLGIYPILDSLLGEDKPVRNIPKSGTPYEVMLHIHSLIHPIVIITLCWRVMLDGNVWTSWAAGLSSGVITGVCSIIVAHELGHKKPRTISWWMGRANLVMSLYAHFTTEHNFNHHKNVSTRLDPASAPKGRGLWYHVLQTIPNQFISAWSTEKRRALKKGKKLLFYKNPVFIGLLIQGLLLGIIWYIFGIWALIVFSGQAFFAIFLLEYVNYIRHYGLHREVGERQTMMHSWQSEKRLSRWTLLELTRHPAHHLKASEPFWKLRPFEDAPNLPTGYFGLFWPCMIPPLWRKLMDHRIPET